MKDPRRYGDAPYGVAVLHGGPGAAGEMAPVALALAATSGVLEPLQTACSLEGQLEELRRDLQAYAEFPVVLIGWSWGAWLAYIYAARFPEQVKKLVLVSAGPFTADYAEGLLETRLGRLGLADRAEAVTLMEVVDDPEAEDKDRVLARLGELFNAADSIEALPPSDENKKLIECRYDIYAGVWNDAARLRESGRLLELGKNIRCPVTAIHGDGDPHPAAGVLGPLSQVIENFRFIMLENCGHKPWDERNARTLFLLLLKEELEDE